jgi:hypothetical protein
MVHVRSQERHRHSVNVLMTFASVPTIRPLQKGQLVGRSTAMPTRGSNIDFSIPTYTAVTDDARFARLKVAVLHVDGSGHD